MRQRTFTAYNRALLYTSKWNRVNSSDASGTTTSRDHRTRRLHWISVIGACPADWQPDSHMQRASVGDICDGSSATLNRDSAVLNYFLDQIPDPIALPTLFFLYCLCFFFFFGGGRPLRKSQKLRRFKSDREEIWQNCSWTQSDFGYDDILSRWRPWRHFA